MAQSVVLGIDGGGTTTRVLAADLEGRVVGYAEGGCARLDRDSEAVQHVQSAIFEVLGACNRDLRDVACLVAGIAGLDSESDEVWVNKLTDIAGLNCTKKHVNDAVIAHAGALLSKPGIIVVSGTGSMIYAITDDGRHIRNYDMHHYANSGARHLAYATLFSVLSSEAATDDLELTREILRHFGLSTLGDLRERLTHEGEAFTQADWPLVGRLAPIITQFAGLGSPVAQRACNRASEEITTGVRLLGGHFGTSDVLVAFIGGVIRSEYMYEETKRRIEDSSIRAFKVVDRELGSAEGAVLMALSDLGIPPDGGVIQNLKNFDAP